MALLKPWTRDDDIRLIENYHLGLEECGRVLGRTPSAVQSRHHRITRDLTMPIRYRNMAKAQIRFHAEH